MPDAGATAMTVPSPRRAAWAIAFFTVLGAVLRVYRLGAWSFSGDEAFTLAFSTDGFTWADLRPLAFAMNHYLAIPLFGPSEVAIRLFPATFGILAIPLIGSLAWRAYGAATGIATSALIALSPGLLSHSQFGRYYMQSYTVTAVVPLALLCWSHQLRLRWLAVAVLSLIVAGLFVPSSVFVAPGLLAWLVACHRDLLSEQALRRIREWRWALVIAVATAGVASLLLAAKVRAAYMVGPLAAGERYSNGAQIALGTVSTLTLPVTLLAAVGLVLCLTDRTHSRPSRLLPIFWAVGSALTFMAAYPFIAIGATHVVSVLAVAHLSAGLALARLWTGTRDRAVAAAATACLMLPLGRDIFSHYADGNHADYRGAAAVVRSLDRQSPGPVYAIGHGNLAPYLPGLRPREFIPAPDSVRWATDPVRNTPVRLVLTEHRRGLDVRETDPSVAAVLAACRLVQRLHRQRLDYYINAVRVYDCPPVADVTPDSTR